MLVYNTRLLLELLLLISTMKILPGLLLTGNITNSNELPDENTKPVDVKTENSTTTSLVVDKNMNTTEFFMSRGIHDEINWYGLGCEALDEYREQSERNFGNTDECPKEMKQGYDLPENEKSNCPWYYEVDHKSTRYPNNILVARTPCFSCIGYDSDYFQCHPITRNITVYNKIEYVEEEIKYETEEIEIPVGFTCGARDFVNGYVNTATPTIPSLY